MTVTVDDVLYVIAGYQHVKLGKGGAVFQTKLKKISDGTIRVSSRSKDARLNVCKICQVFGGGGHVMASGARVEGPLIAAQERVIAVAQAAVVEAGIEPFQQ